VNVEEEKQALRRRMKDLRGSLSPAGRRKLDEAVSRQLLELLRELGAETVYLYASYGSEADTWRLTQALLAKKVPVAFPRVEGKDLRFYRVSSMEQLAAGYWGILEPGPSCQPAKDLSAPVVTPGLAFDREGRRLGYGGGYYDRFFAWEQEHLRIGAAYPFQVVERVPGEGWDLSVDSIVTGEAVIGCGNRRGRNE